MSGELTLLIDGDVIAFTAASAVQREHEDDFGFVTQFANRHEGEAVVDNLMLGLEIDFKSTHYRVALSDPIANWRRGVFPNYKANRRDVSRPLLLDKLKQYLRDKYGAFHWPSLEADDVLGILLTEPQAYDGTRILVGKDKDFLTIPCKYHRIGDRDAKGKPVVRETTPWEAQRFHLFQTLAGDAVDGYPGCPNIGKTRAADLLDNPVLLRPQHGVVTRGPRKGETTPRWVAEPTTDLWAMVVSQYRKAGQGEAEALVTARLAHILRHEDYNRDTESITLWTPDRIKPV
jgi:DNA polymerase-1